MKYLYALLVFAMLLSAAPPAVGDKAPDFTLTSLDGKPVQLSQMTASSPVVLVVLRGYPGYQCPLCNRQVKDFTSKAAEFEGKTVLFVYPGPADIVKDKAMEFAADKNLPANFHMLLDPDYKFTLQYELRWDAPKETAYPSTFLINRDGKIFFSRISKTHGGRTTAEEVLKALKQ